MDKLTAINSNSQVKIYTNHTYMYNSAGSVVTLWPLANNVNLTISNVSGTIANNVTVIFGGPARNIPNSVTWNVYVPKGISSGQYYFYYFVEFTKS